MEDKNIQVKRRKDPLRDFHSKDGHFVEINEENGDKARE